MRFKIPGFLLVLMFLSIQIYAQEHANNNSTYQKSQMAKDLGLDEEIAIAFDSITKSYKSEIYAVKIKSSSKKNLKKLSALEEKRDKELQTLLTKEQFDTFVELRQKERENMRSLIRKKQ